MSIKKILVALLIVLVAVGGFGAGLYLLKDKQNISKEASVPDGKATASFNPETGTYNIGDTIQTAVYFNTASIPVSAVRTKILYPYSGATPEVTVTSITVNPALLTTGDWTCPTQNSMTQGTNVVIDIACTNLSASGFTSSQNTLLANISLKIQRAPSSSPLVLRFDQAESVITRRSDNQDILLIPSSMGSYVIGGVGPTSTPTLKLTTTPTSKLTTTPTTKLTGTPTPTTKLTGTPTPTAAQLPDAGISLPTIMGLFSGIVIIAGAFLLAL